MDRCLPIVPPTEELVDSMIAASGRDAMEVLGVVPPRHGIATIEAIATNAVMAGCRPSTCRLSLPRWRRYWTSGSTSRACRRPAIRQRPW